MSKRAVILTVVAGIAAGLLIGVPAARALNASANQNHTSNMAAAIATAPDDKPKCSFDNSVHRTTFAKIQVTQKVHYKWCASNNAVWSTPRWVKDTWRTLSGGKANCAHWTRVHTRTRFSDYMGRTGHVGNTVFCHNRSRFSRWSQVKHAKRYFWGKDNKPTWLAYVKVAHANRHRNEYGTVVGRLDPFELPLVIRIFVSAAASARMMRVVV